VEEVQSPEGEEVEANGEGELLEISLHEIVGALAPKTMRLVGSINNQAVVVLIDTGSTHSFLNPNVARRAKLPIHETRKLTLKVANGDFIPCQGCCLAVQVTLQGHTLTTSLLLLTLGGCDLVLGVNWLRILSPILWDFVDLTMKF
jgi:hypothetical protein